MSRLIVLPRHLQVITQHAALAYPEECCGILMGRQRRGDEGTEETVLVERILSAQNEFRPESRRNRYLIPPEALLSAEKQARGLGLEVVGYYHSHPDHPAVPSDFDREHAWPGVSYLIVSVRQGEVAATRSWRLAEDRSRFVEETIVEGGEAPAARRPKEAVR